MSGKATKNQIIKAVQELKNRATVADVVARTGVSLEQASHYLNELAAETNATLAVAESGKLYYLFPPTFSYFYLTKGIRKALGTAFQWLAGFLYFAFRISFGIGLLFSVLSISFTILTFQALVLTFMGESQAATNLWEEFLVTLGQLAGKDPMVTRISNELKRRSTRGDVLRSSLKLSLESKFKNIFAGRIGRGAQENFSDNSAISVSEKLGEEPLLNAPVSVAEGEGLLLDCFHFLFGEPDPNAQIEEERWRLLAQVIRLNEGVVLPEHLGPYIGKDPDDEQALFKVLLKFDGKPVVSEKGVITYVFPLMSDRSENGSYVMMPEKLLEKTWRFLPIPRERVKPVFLLACFNLIGSVSFFWLLICGSLKTSAHATFFLCLAIYSAFFFCIPAVRFLIVQQKNRAIGKRNERAASFEERLGRPDQALLEKLSEAEKIRGAELQKSKDRIIYSTEKDYLEQINTEDFLRDSSRSS